MHKDFRLLEQILVSEHSHHSLIKNAPWGGLWAWPLLEWNVNSVKQSVLRHEAKGNGNMFFVFFFFNCLKVKKNIQTVINQRF